MTILDRKPKKYSTSDLFWQPEPAPIDGIVGDINTMTVKPEHLGMGQDVIVDTNGILRSRGSVTSITTDTFSNIGHTGVAQISGGTILVGKDTSGDTYLYGTSASALTGFTKLYTQAYGTGTSPAGALLSNNHFQLFSAAKIPNDGGAILAGQTGNPGSIEGATFIWGGNVTLTGPTSTGTASSTQGNKTITGVGTAWTSALIGCFLSLSGITGQVDAVASTTSLTLKKGAAVTVAGATPIFYAARSLRPLIYKGRITTNTATTNVIGSGTKFNSSGILGGGGALIVGSAIFRYSDGALVGVVSSVQNDTTLTLTGVAAVNMANEEYYMLSSGAGATSWFANSVELFADRYWYGGIQACDIAAPSNVLGPYPFNGGNSLMFTKKNEPEFFDMSQTNGDVITLPQGANPDAIKGLSATRGGLVVFRNNDTFLITGYSPETFRAIKILDDGIMNCHCMRPYREGVIFAGSKSVWYFDGTRIVDVLQNKLSRFYKIGKNNSAGTPSGMAVTNDFVMVSYTRSLSWPYKNTTKTTNHVTMVINMLNGSVTFFTNLYVTSSLLPNPISVGSSANAVIMARSTGQITSTTCTSYLLSSSFLFADSSSAAANFDAITTAPTFTTGVQIGPDVMFETTKLSLGNAARMKFWKMFLMNYSSDVGMTATFISTNDTTQDFPSISTGTAGVVTFPVSSNIGILKRIKFLVRTPTLSIRVYQTSTPTSASQRFKMFWYTVGGKWMREGRQQ